MNRLDADLKRLMTWAGRATPSQPEAAPFGFASRVVAACAAAPAPSLLFELQQIAWFSGCVSAVVILCGVVLLVSQPHAPEPAAGLPSAVRFLASNFNP